MYSRLRRTPSRRKSGARSFSALGAGTASRGHRGFVFNRRFLPLLLSHGRLIADRFNGQEEDQLKYES
jgi:hypothetical protein